MTATLRETAELRHGYTLADIDKMARVAASTLARPAHGVSYADAFDDAWSTIVEALYTADEPPVAAHLIVSARNAIYRGYRDDNHHRGVQSAGSAQPGQRMPHAVAYWLTNSHTTTFDNRVVERVALTQIWPRLSAGERRAITALAVWGSHHAAAEATGEPYDNARQLVLLGRRRFLRYWHEGETPSRKWGMDHPGNGGLGKYRKKETA